MSKKRQDMCSANGNIHRKGQVAALPFLRLWKVFDPILFQMTLVASLLAAVYGDCDIPSSLPFASPINALTETRFKTGTVLKYTCRPGYRQNNANPTLTCDRGGLWYYTEFCDKKRCSNPGDLPNGQVEISTDYSFGSKIEFSCLEGYILIGSTTSYCEIQGNGVGWSDPAPECIIVKCLPPPNIENGKHNGGEKDYYKYSSAVTYTCDPHFSLLGKASISCTVENKTLGVWSPSPPTCEKIICPQPTVSNGSIVSGFRHIYAYKDSVLFNCKKGFLLTGSSLIHCGADRKWNPSPPTCELNGCLGLPDITHASWGRYGTQWLEKEEVYNIGTVLWYQCNLGYRHAATKPSRVTCQKNLTWTPFLGCVGCKFPPEVVHGHYEKVRGLFSTEFVYECDTGYTMVGEAKTSCDDSIWSPPPPQCKAQCSRPEIANGKLSLNKPHYIETETVTVQCSSGYAVVGSPTITCSENRSWYPEMPTCEWIIPDGCEQVVAGKHLMQCLPDPQHVKLALELYKLSLEIESLELQRDKARKSTVELSSPKEEGKEASVPSTECSKVQVNNFTVPLLP
ncbi:C4b-binding protein alpha chain isoform X2 [Tamandua tetradactyla]|uniref:C4b-binding protein alpha chain isoform X2 n=1 Tax=Tamandua tetradactyla TaxID=48850 RepID=UPI004053B82E